MEPKRAAFSGSTVTAKAGIPAGPAASGGSRPDLPPAVPEYFLPITSPAASPLPIVYVPALFTAADVLFTDKSKDISTKQRFVFLTRIQPDQTALPGESETVALDPATLAKEPVPGALSWGALPLFARKASTYTEAKSAALERLYQQQTLDIHVSRRLGEYAKPGES